MNKAIKIAIFIAIIASSCAKTSINEADNGDSLQVTVNVQNVESEEPVVIIEPILNESDVSFVDSTQRLGLGRSTDVALGDIDGDGDLDAVVTNAVEGGAGNEVWVNDGNGSFTAREQDLGYGWALELTDIDGDQDLDVIIVSWDAPAKIWLNDGTGLFIDSGQELGEPSGWDVGVGDLDNDGDMDIYIGHEFANSVWLNDGGGNFTDTYQILGESFSAGIGISDLDGDGDLDVISAGWNENGKVWINDGSGMFIDSEQVLSPGYYHMHGLAIDDINNDGMGDAILTGYPSQVWINNGTGTFLDSGEELCKRPVDTATVGDVDGDGDLDLFLAIADTFDEKNSLWLNDGNGNFVDSEFIFVLEGFNSGAELGDLDGDGDLDVFITLGNLGASTGGELPNEVWINNSP